jgi:hypothetical protein
LAEDLDGGGSSKVRCHTRKRLRAGMITDQL